MQKPWTLIQLNVQKTIDMQQSCHTKLERSMCETICNKEIRELAAEILKTRKLTPGERAVLDNL
jgi:hypothetical protein